MNATTVAPLLAAAELQPLQDLPQLLLLDCRFDLANPAAGRAAYDAGHIPGAQFVEMEHELTAPRRHDTGRHPLPAAADFAGVLGRLGFTPASRVVVYDQGNGAAAARLWWMLRARGHAQVQVLDGGWAAWLAAGGAISTSRPAPQPTEVPVREFAGVLDASQVAAALTAGSITLVDARAADRFAGRNESIDPVAGHIPGARNLPYTHNLDAAQQFLPASGLRQLWAPLVESGRPLVMMCGSGITACHNLLALEQAGFGGARLYAGSWSDWITDPARPVATGE